MPLTDQRIPENQIRFLTTSADYFDALAASLPLARRSILIVGWSLDDRIVLNRVQGGEEKRLGDLLLEQARTRPELTIQLRIWDAPPVFTADQHISDEFSAAVEHTPNIDLKFLPSASAFAARHEKYVVLDTAIAFLGGIDLTHSRWDTRSHTADREELHNPNGRRYVPYHDVQMAVSGPLVRALLEVARDDGLIDDPPQDLQPWWPEGLDTDARNAEMSIARTRLYPDTSRPSVNEIRTAYLDMIEAAQTRIYIENQYFSSDVITDAVIRRIQAADAPEVIIIMSRELPDTLGRVTMGANNSLQLSRLLDEDTNNKVAFFSRVAQDDPSTTVKVHSKLMIVDGRYLTIGSANISKRSFGMDSELNVLLDAKNTDTPQCVSDLEVELICQHTGLDPEDWRKRVQQHAGSWRAALASRASEWSGLMNGAQAIDPARLPAELVEKLDMGKPPQAESALQGLVQTGLKSILSRLRQAALVVLAIGIVSGIAVLLARIDVDIDATLESVRNIYRDRRILGIILTIGSYWLSMSVFVSILVPVIFFAAVYGPPLGILFSIIGLFSGAFVYYRIGLLIYDADWIDRFKAVRAAKRQLERVKPYGVWAVALSRMIPSGPFAVVNFVTGLLGFTFTQFFVGSLIGLLPGIVAFSVFGDIVRKVFSDPSWVNIGLLAAFIVAYFVAARLLLTLIRKVAGWASASGDS
ncbi:MAG: VTT domain-containing protein [Spirochaetaceae bacterium]